MKDLWVIGDRGHVAGPCESVDSAEATRIWGDYVYEPERFRVVEHEPQSMIIDKVE